MYRRPRQFSFDTKDLSDAIQLTFKQRETEIPEVLDIFEKGFADAKQNQWAAFCKRLKKGSIPLSFCDITSEIKSFLEPVIALIR